MTDRANVTAIVLAGGRSSRFGGLKLEASLDGRTLLEHAIGIGRAVAGDVVLAIAAGTGDSLERPGVRVVSDEQPFEGPLAGLASALATVSTPLAVVIAGDMPRLAPAVLAAMLDALDDRDDPDGPARAVVLADGETPSPLPLALRVEPARSAAIELLKDGERSLRALVARLEARVLTEPEWRALDPAGGSLVDIDRPEDLQRLAERASDGDVREVR